MDKFKKKMSRMYVNLYVRIHVGICVYVCMFLLAVLTVVVYLPLPIKDIVLALAGLFEALLYLIFYTL